MFDRIEPGNKNGDYSTYASEPITSIEPVEWGISPNMALIRVLLQEPTFPTILII